MKNIKVLLLLTLFGASLPLCADDNDASEQAAVSEYVDTSSFGSMYAQSSGSVYVDASSNVPSNNPKAELPQPQTQQPQLPPVRESYLAITPDKTAVVHSLNPKVVHFGTSTEKPKQYTYEPVSPRNVAVKSPKQKSSSQDSKIITIDSWQELPARQLSEGTLLVLNREYEVNRKTVIESKEYVVESDQLFRGYNRKVALAEKKTISWMGRYVTTVEMSEREVRGKISMIMPSISRTYKYYEPVRWSSMAALAAVCFTALNLLNV